MYNEQPANTDTIHLPYELPARVVELLRGTGAEVQEYSRYKHGVGVIYETVVIV